MQIANKRLPWLVIALVIYPLTRASTDAPVQGDSCPSQSTRVGSLNKATVDTREDYSKIKVLRGSTHVTAHPGLSLCAGDVLSTTGSAEAVVSMIDAAGARQDISISKDTTVELVDRRSIVLRLGQIYVRARSYFDAATTAITLGIRGTQFELRATPSGTSVSVIEGNVTANSTDVRQKGLSEWIRENIFKSPRKFPTVRSLEIHPLEAVSFAAGEEKPLSTIMTAEQCRAIVQSNSAAFALAKPEFSAFSLTPFYVTLSERAKAFQEAQVAALCDKRPSSAVDLEKLGDVFADWADGDRALYYYAQVDSPPGNAKTNPTLVAKIANALRLKGDLDAAEKKYKQSIELDNALALPYSGLGDVFLDRGHIKIDKKEYQDAVADLKQALRFYGNALERATTWPEGREAYKAVTHYHLGEASLYLAVAQSEDSAPFNTETSASLDAAQINFDKSSLEWPQYPFAQTGRSLLLLTEAQMLDNGVEYRRADALLKEANEKLVPILGPQSRFAFGQFLLGEIFEESKKSGQIIEQYTKAIEVDPFFAEPYYKIGGLLGTKEQLSPYLNGIICTNLVAYLENERPTFRATDKFQSLLQDGHVTSRAWGPNTEDNPLTFTKGSRVSCDFSAFNLMKIPDDGQ